MEGALCAASKAVVSSVLLGSNEWMLAWEQQLLCGGGGRQGGRQGVRFTKTFSIGTEIK
jgi:hypothetical protein